MRLAICEHILRTLHNLLIFLDYECLEGVPLAMAWMLVYFPITVQPSIVEFMCAVVIPLIYSKSYSSYPSLIGARLRQWFKACHVHSFKRVHY